MVWYGQALLPTLFIFPPWGFFSPTGIVRHAPWNLHSFVSSWWSWASSPSSLHALLLGIPEYNGVLLQVFLRSGVWLPWLLHEQHRRKLLVVHVRWKSTVPSSLGKLCWHLILAQCRMQWRWPQMTKYSKWEISHCRVEQLWCLDHNHSASYQRPKLHSDCHV